MGIQYNAPPLPLRGLLYPRDPARCHLAPPPKLGDFPASLRPPPPAAADSGRWRVLGGGLGCCTLGGGGLSGLGSLADLRLDTLLGADDFRLEVVR